MKVLIRGLIALKPQLARHGADEINWVDIWLAEMVRQESYPFFVRLLEGDTLDELVGTTYRLRNSDSRKKLGADEKAANADIDKLIQEIGGLGESKSDRMIELINATRVLGGYHILYNWKFALRPEALTWKEFHDLMARWTDNQHQNTICDWIDEHASANSLDVADIGGDLFETMLKAKQTAASQAADATPAEDNARHNSQATLLLK